MKALRTSAAAFTAALLVAACGGGSGGGPAGVQVSTPSRGQLMQSPPLRVTSLSATEFAGVLQASGSTGASLLALSTGSATGTLPCGVDVQYIKYGTVGGNGEATTATGALMVPTGTTPTCTGAGAASGGLPIVVYAHGTTITKRYNIADLTDSTNPAYSEALLLAALYAAQGYIVVAPNYAGYDASTLPYHPYMNASQQSKDMIDALAAAKSALPTLISPTTAGSKLFLTGYSQGGFVAMATQKALESATPPVTVTAAAPMSGPYAVAAYLDAIFGGSVPIGATAFAPLLINSYKNSYPTVTFYNALTDIYQPGFASGIDTLVPGQYDFTTVYSSGKLPQTALFSNNANFPMSTSTPFGFDPTTYLITDTYRGTYLADAAAHPDGAVPTATTYLPSTTALHPLRVQAALNDLRGFAPVAPVLLCGGDQDPTVFYSVNTALMAGLWGAHNNWKVLDLESTGTSTMTGAAIFQGLFSSAKTSTYTSAYNAALTAGQTTTAATAAATQAVAVNYHGSLVPPYCNKAAKTFFDAF